MSRFWLLLLMILSCGDAGKAKPQPKQSSETHTVSIIGLNDLHGHIERLPILAGYLNNLRAARERQIVILDAGDMFQGTLVSNKTEGAPVIDIYNQLGVAAAAVGNHEFDFGPAGPKSTATEPGDDPFGALKAAAKKASFPLLMANIAWKDSGRLPDWPNIKPTHMVKAGNVSVGVIGVSTAHTLTTTRPDNVTKLKMLPAAPEIVRHAKQLRNDGAVIVAVVAHAGGKCREHKQPDDLSSCDMSGEIFQLARQLPSGLVDIIVAGHTHAGIAHRVNGIAIIESFARGTAFGRVDFQVSGEHATDSKIFSPQTLCQGEYMASLEECKPFDYEGNVAADPKVAAILRKAEEQTKSITDENLGVIVEKKLKRSYKEESALGNAVVDLLLAHVPDADIAITNGGGLRADWDAGPLTYGDVFEALPFDNQLVRLTLSGKQFKGVIAKNLGSSRGILSVGGVTVSATCKGKDLQVQVLRATGKPIADSETLTVLTNDYLVSGGDGGLLTGKFSKATPVGRLAMRDVVAQALRKRGGTMSAKMFYAKDNKRLRYPGKRPVRCGK